jgi:hypothetical protein
MKNKPKKQKPIAAHPMMEYSLELWMMGKVGYDTQGNPSVANGIGDPTAPLAGDIQRITWYRKALIGKAKYLQAWLKAAKDRSKAAPKGGPKG